MTTITVDTATARRPFHFEEVGEVGTVCKTRDGRVVAAIARVEGGWRVVPASADLDHLAGGPTFYCYEAAAAFAVAVAYEGEALS